MKKFLITSLALLALASMLTSCGGISILYEAGAENTSAEQMEAAAGVIQGRLDSMGYTGAEVSIVGEKRIKVDIPEAVNEQEFQNAQEAMAQLGATAELMFAEEAAESNPSDEALGLNIFLTGEMVESAEAMVQTQQQGSIPEYVVALDFTPEGQVIFEEATARNIGKPIYILMDNQMLSAPTVSERITGGSVIISGGFTREQAKNLADMIQGGALPFTLNVISYREGEGNLNDMLDLKMANQYNN
ncbi:MAG: hypothetical protein LBS21_05100 [Clostridiales bacterium]|nr:hypothetical protein [Clostridiales bacterium]